MKRKMKQGIDRLPSQGPDPADKFRLGWRLASAAVVERYPIVMPDVEEFEDEYRIGRFTEQQHRARTIDPSWFLSEQDKVEGITEPTFEDPQGDRYEPGPRITEADRTNDRKSVERALPERLYFLVRRTEKSTNMQFPQVLVGDDKVTMSSYAEKAFKGVTVAASRPPVHFLSHSPACHLEHVYPSKYQEKHDVYGVKIFFYRGILMSGKIEGVRNAVDYMWARECELGDMLGEEYHAAIKPILFGVGPSVQKASKRKL